MKKIKNILIIALLVIGLNILLLGLSNYSYAADQNNQLNIVENANKTNNINTEFNTKANIEKNKENNIKSDVKSDTDSKDNTSTKNSANNVTENNSVKNNSNTINKSLKAAPKQTTPVQKSNNTKANENLTKLGVMYDTHIQNIGWETSFSKKDEDTSGTTGRSLRLEAIHIKLYGTESSNLKVKYQVHVQNIGWQHWNENGAMAGTTGRGLRLEAIKIRLENSDNYSIQYRVHIENIGWQNWETDGDIAGTTGRSLRLEAIEIKIVPKVKKVSMYIDTPSNNSLFYTPSKIKVSGWKMSNIKNTKIRAYIDNTEITNISYSNRNDVIKAIEGYGTAIENKTPGFSFSIDTSDTTKIKDGIHTIKVDVCTSDNKVLKETTIKVNIDRQLHVQYQAHIQDIGWQGYVEDGALEGTTGRSLRVEALKINLINAPKNARIRYRTHVQNIGWQGWRTDWQMAGTSGQCLRIEAIQIALDNMNNYTVEYQVHIQDKGWSGWYIDGETAGTVGQSKRIEAIRIRIVPKYKRSYKGIDVSEHQKTIDWQKVKSSGIDFAILRVGWIGNSENHTLDKQFQKNYTECKRLGIPVGAYVYSYCVSDQATLSGANWTINQLRGKNLTLPVFIDVEDSQIEPLDRNSITSMCLRFCDTLYSNGYKTGVYASKTWLENKINADNLGSYEKWIAQWNSTCTYNGNYSIWQYTDNGTVNGIDGNVDMDISYKKY